MKIDPHLISDHANNMELILLCERLVPHIISLFVSNQVHIRSCLFHGDLSSQNYNAQNCSDLLDKWRSLAFQSVTKLSIDCGVWTSSLVRFPCEIQMQIDTIKLPLSIKQQQPSNQIEPQIVSLTRHNNLTIERNFRCPLSFYQLTN
ncbi:unnamed protein product [Rotaria socialis]|uniref:Uncharacterized protein n=1 Tax=Rotaria socialis TaxID=392032 RepID=A0A820KV80_9BILA|nr:unnamed protein product [Rotaria socialis]CAF4347086.1 unnamed protein product [Rotaria socialis]